jgi:hypothetical protein
MAYNNMLLMPGDGAVNPFTIPGTTRKYTCAAGATLSVPDFDAAILLGVGWVNSLGTRGGNVGTTAQRPANPPANTVFNDTTVGAAVVYGGPRTGWLHHSSGASV